jgi:hypothetical protein
MGAAMWSPSALHVSKGLVGTVNDGMNVAGVDKDDQRKQAHKPNSDCFRRDGVTMSILQVGRCKELGGCGDALWLRQER